MKTMQMTIVVTKAFTISNLKPMSEEEQKRFAEEFGQNVVIDTYAFPLEGAELTESEELENNFSVARES